uniref:Venom S1 protease 11 n=1 Tax=Ectomocoris sp. TaxID=3104572 RepID=A0AB38ZE85_9HEMI
MDYNNFLYFILFFTLINKSRCGIGSDEYGVTPGSKETSCPCGNRNVSPSRIASGTETQMNEFPFMAGIRTKASPFIFCGGTIITTFHVLTAAHCTDPRKYEKLAVVVGAHNPYEDLNKNAKLLDVKDVIDHEKFDLKGEVENDISIIVTEKMTFNYYIQPACLPVTKLQLINQPAKIMGWGKLFETGPYSEVLRKVDLKIVSLEDCDENLNGIDTEHPTQLCTFSETADSCQGDSGGPVVWRNPETNRFSVVGIVSFGEKCGNANATTINTDVFAYKDWILKTISETRSSGKTCS